MAQYLSDDIKIKREATVDAVQTILKDLYYSKRKGVLIKNQKDAFLYLLRTQKELTGFNHKNTKTAYEQYRKLRFNLKKQKEHKRT